MLQTNRLHFADIVDNFVIKLNPLTRNSFEKDDVNYYQEFYAIIHQTTYLFSLGRVEDSYQCQVQLLGLQRDLRSGRTHQRPSR